MPELTRKLTLQERTREPDGAGGYLEAWTDLGFIWAHVRAKSGREAVQGGGEVSAMRYELIVRAAAESSPQRPRPDQRFKDRQRYFLIETVSDHSSPLFLKCIAREERAS